MHNKLYLYLEQNNVLYHLHIGFRNGHSATLPLLEITEKIREACEKLIFSCVIFRDFKKAFDTVSHPILIP